MKLLYQKGTNGLELSYVECTSTEEADQFQSWFINKIQGVNDGRQAEIQFEKEEATTNAASEPVQETKVTRPELSKLAIALVQTKGRDAIEPILKKYNAKRISEIPEDKLTLAYADVAEAM